MKSNWEPDGAELEELPEDPPEPPQTIMSTGEPAAQQIAVPVYYGQ